MKGNETPLPERIEKLREIFHAALDRPASERAAFLTQVCGDDLGLRTEVESLIAEHEDESDFLATPVPELLAEQDAGLCSGDSAPGNKRDLPFERLGDFRLIRKLGEGGMGVVYVAVQEPLEREVALKIMRSDVAASKDVSQRFAREAEAIARLSHPNIVTVHGAGEENGVQYFTMELLPGKGLDEVLREARAEGKTVHTPKIIQWTRDIARALEAAHEAGVIHRDVKPSNIRITPDGRAMLLDFGIARQASLLQLTRTGTFRGTPHYASPEQIKVTRLEIDERTDIYSLGVTLYESVTGRVPFDGETTEQVFHQILHIDPIPPRRLNPGLPRDVGTVTLKAVEKERGRRYPTMAAFADDLERIMRGEMILARPASFGAHLWKRIKRNPAASAAMGVGVLALFALVGYILIFSYPQIRRERDKAWASESKAERQALVATKVTDFLSERVLGAFRAEMRDDALLLTKMLGRATEHIESDLGSVPVAEAGVRRAMGKAYARATQWEQAENNLCRAVELNRIHLGDEHPDTLDCLYHYAKVLSQRRSHDKAERAWSDYLLRAKRSLGEAHSNVVEASYELACVFFFRGRSAQGIDLVRDLYANLRDRYGEEHLMTLTAMQNLFLCLSDVGGPSIDESKRLAKSCLDLQRKVLGSDHDRTIETMHTLTAFLERQGEYEEQLRLRREWAEAHRR